MKNEDGGDRMLLSRKWQLVVHSRYFHPKREGRGPVPLAGNSSLYNNNYPHDLICGNTSYLCLLSIPEYYVLDWHTRLICPFRHARLNCPFRQHGSLHFAGWAAEMLPMEEGTSLFRLGGLGFPDCSPISNPNPAPIFFAHQSQPSKPSIRLNHRQFLQKRSQTIIASLNRFEQSSRAPPRQWTHASSSK